MIYNGLLVPHERPVTLREIKRALLTYDKVLLVDPADRDMMPANSLMSVLIGLPIMGIDMGPARPMGKAPGYDDAFTRAFEGAAEARRQGLLEVRSTYDLAQTKQATIGAVMTGGYPLHPNMVFGIYRNMASDQTYLRKALDRDGTDVLRDVRATPDLAMNGRADGAINEVPALPLIDGVDEPEQLQLTQVARARIGAFIKYAGYCEAKEVVPLFNSRVYGSLGPKLLDRAGEALSANSDDPFWQRRTRVLQLCHEEYLIDDRLDAMSIEDVLRLRTAAWGNQAEARERLFEAILELAQDHGQEVSFEHAARQRISEYRRAAEVVTLERRNLEFQIKCEIAKVALGTGPVVAGLMSQIEPPLRSIGLTLLAGGVWALDKARSYVPQFRAIRAREEELKRGGALAIHDFYSRLTTQ